MRSKLIAALIAAAISGTAHAQSDLIKGEMTWVDVAKVARKGKR